MMARAERPSISRDFAICHWDLLIKSALRKYDERNEERPGKEWVLDQTDQLLEYLDRKYGTLVHWLILWSWRSSKLTHKPATTGNTGTDQGKSGDAEAGRVTQ